MTLPFGSTVPMRPIPQDRQAEERVLAAVARGVLAPRAPVVDALFFTDMNRRHLMWLKRDSGQGPDMDRILSAHPDVTREEALSDVAKLRRASTQRDLIQLFAQALEEVYIDDIDLDDFIPGLAAKLAFIGGTYHFAGSDGVSSLHKGEYGGNQAK